MNDKPDMTVEEAFPGVEMSDLQDPSLAFYNQKGEVVFQMKRKAQYGDYYIFQVFEDRMDAETHKKWKEIFPVMKTLALVLEIELFNFDEINAGLAKKLKELAVTYASLPEAEQKKRALGYPTLGGDSGRAS